MVRRKQRKATRETKERRERYYNNREQRLAQQRNCEEHKEQKMGYDKVYHKEHKENRSEQAKERYEKYKDQITQNQVTATIKNKTSNIPTLKPLLHKKCNVSGRVGGETLQSGV